MRGRKPKPTLLKLINGNAGRRPLNQHEPMPEGDLADAPEWLTARQQEGWAYAIRESPPGLLKRLDRTALATWVVAEDLHRDAAEKVAQYGPVIKAPITGVPIQSPYMAILNRQALILMKAAAEMGFTPSSRSRIELQPTGAASDPARRYFT